MAWQWRTMKWMMGRLPDAIFDHVMQGYWSGDELAVAKFEYYAKLATAEAANTPRPRPTSGLRPAGAAISSRRKPPP